jgi:hypothetical protein
MPLWAQSLTNVDLPIGEGRADRTDRLRPGRAEPVAVHEPGEVEGGALGEHRGQDEPERERRAQLDPVLVLLQPRTWSSKVSTGIGVGHRPAAGVGGLLVPQAGVHQMASLIRSRGTAVSKSSSVGSSDGLGVAGDLEGHAACLRRCDLFLDEPMGFGNLGVVALGLFPAQLCGGHLGAPLVRGRCGGELADFVDDLAHDHGLVDGPVATAFADAL